MRGFTPSTANRWVKCPGSVRLSEPYLNTFGISEAAKEGIAAHWVIEELHAKREVKVGQRTSNDEIVTEEMLEGAVLFLDNLPEGATIETPVDCSSLHQGMRGRIDAVAVAGGVLRILDYKYGHRPVSPIENEQLMVEAIAVCDNLASEHEIHTVELTIVQPRCYGHDPVNTWKLSKERLFAEHRPRIVVAIEDATSDDPVLNTGSHCVFCPARHACPALREVALNIVDVSKSAMNMELDENALGDELALLEDAEERIRARISGLQEMAKVHIENNKIVKNYKSEAKYGLTGWTVPTETLLLTADTLGVDLRKPEAAITPKQAVKKGLAKTLVEEMSEAKYKGHELKRIDFNKSKEVFKK